MIYASNIQYELEKNPRSQKHPNLMQQPITLTCIPNLKPLDPL